LIPFVQAEQEKQKNRSRLSVDISIFLDTSRSLLQKTEALLDSDDRLRLKIEKMVTQVEKAINNMTGLLPVEKG
jgi:hypothetical protein